MRPFLFSWPQSNEPGENIRWLVAFISHPDPSLLPESIAEYLERDFSFERLVIVGFTFNRLATLALHESGRLDDRLPPIFRNKPALIEYWFIGPNGTIQTETGTTCDPRKTAGLFHAGAEAMFFDHSMHPPCNPILEAPIGFHFVKPSKEHSSHFIRVAELLRKGEQIEFLGASLLRWITSSISRIACDSGSIMSVAYAAAMLFHRINAADLEFGKSLSVSSFGSWGGILPKRGEIRAEYSPDETTLYVVSASTSGSLTRKMKRLGFPSCNTVTLYQYGSDAGSGHVICKLTPPRSNAGRNLPEIEVYSPKSCPWCKLRSSPLMLRGDQFLPLEAKKDTFEVSLVDCPKWLQTFLTHAVNTKVISAHHGYGDRGRIHEVFIHFDRLCESKSFRKRIDQAIRQSVSYAFDRMFVCNDDGARALAALINRSRRQRNLPKPEIICAGALEQLPASRYRTNKSSIVVAGCVASGRSLMKVSRLLRDIEKGGAASYFIGLRRTSTSEDEKYLESTLRFASDGRVRFALQSIDDIYVSDNTPDRPSIWTQEKQFLERLREKAAGRSDFPRNLVDRRIETICDAEGNEMKGLYQNLFWPSINGQLKLRSNFSIVSDKLARQLTQAELYFVISSLFHRVRSTLNEARSLRNSAHRRTLLHPKNFGRFNDGVLRACVIRAAHSAELDFELDEKMDSEATGLICEIVAARGKSEGEATTEFLLALAMGHMRLGNSGLREVSEAVKHAYPDPLTIEFHLGSEIEEIAIHAETRRQVVSE